MGDSDKIPISLEKLLTVTPSGGLANNTAVEPSQLLAKLNTFLPKLKEANKALLSEDSHKMNSIPAPVVVTTDNTALPSSETKTVPSTELAASQANDELAVNMDVYLDNSLGELVPNAESAKIEDGEDKTKTLIEEVE